MTKFNNPNQAMEAIQSEAAADALEWLQREKPQTAEAIEYLVLTGWSEAKIFNILEKNYQDTEPRAQHKMRLVVKKLISQREDG